jgi:hypothetical protein
MTTYNKSTVEILDAAIESTAADVASAETGALRMAVLLAAGLQTRGAGPEAAMQLGLNLAGAVLRDLQKTMSTRGHAISPADLGRLLSTPGQVEHLVDGCLERVNRAVTAERAARRDHGLGAHRA